MQLSSSRTLVDRLHKLPLTWRLIVAFIFGAIAASGFAPLFLLPLFALGFTGLFLLLEKGASYKQQLLIVFFFTWGHFIAGHYWIGIAFFVDAGRFGWLVPLPVLGLPALLALFPTVAIGVVLRFPAQGLARVLLLALGWSLGDFARSNLFTGFPWNLAGYVWAFSPVTLQPLALFGIHGLSLCTLIFAMMPALFLRPAYAVPHRHWGAVVVLCGIGIAVTAGFWRLETTPREDFPGVNLRLVQPSIAQSLKWADSERAKNFRKYVELSVGPGVELANVWIWPESAITYFIEYEPELLAALQQLAGADRLFLAGTIRRTPRDKPLQIYNSLVAIHGEGLAAYYDKKHLVPFGEYLPFRNLLGAIGLDKLTVGTVDFSPGHNISQIHIPGLPAARVLICYETIFPDEIVSPSEARPDWLLNVTNDGWYGLSSGPYQHFAAAQARAIEQGLPLVRAANNGISAIIDPLGRIVADLGLNHVGVVDGPLPKPVEAPPFARFGEWLYGIMALLTIMIVLGLRRRDKQLMQSGS